VLAGRKVSAERATSTFRAEDASIVNVEVSIEVTI
jgi:hypothetical protein